MTPDQIAIQNLTTRLNLIDGQSLPVGTAGSILQLQKDLAGVKTTLNQVSLLIEQAFTDLTNRVVALEGSVRTLTGS